MLNQFTGNHGLGNCACVHAFVHMNNNYFMFLIVSKISQRLYSSYLLQFINMFNFLMLWVMANLRAVTPSVTE